MSLAQRDARLQKSALAVAILYGICLAFFMGESVGTLSAKSALFLIFFYAWAVGPIALFTLFVFRLRPAREKVAALAFQVLLFSVSLYAYFDGRYIHPDPQNGLMYLFLPLYSYIAIAVLAGMLHLYRYATNNDQNGSQT